MNKYAIFVNTCDKFEDCWDPFFKLFSIYWPDFKGQIYLNTEYKEFKYPGLNIVSIKNCEKTHDAHQITWSECLRRGLNAIDNDIVLYMQEDYFLKAKANNDLVEYYAQLMHNNDIDCIHLTDQNTNEPLIESSPYVGLWTIPYNIEYRISCQAALWKKEILNQYIRPYESAWNFEEFGTKRAEVLKHNFYSVDRTKVKLNTSEIIPYIFTGIIKGSWFEQVPLLFAAHDIIVDYSIRGIVSNRVERTVKKKIEDKIKRFPNYVKNIFDIMKLKNN